MASAAAENITPNSPSAQETKTPTAPQVPSKPKDSQIDDLALAAMWKKISLKQVMKSPLQASFVTVDSTTKLIDSCETLIKHKISSVPVCAEDGRITGMFDWRDFSVGIVTAWASRPASELEEIKLFSELMQYVPTQAVADISMHNHWYSINEHQSMQEALQFFGQGIHRVTVVDNHHKPIGLLSQSDAIQALYPLLSTDLQELGSRTLADLKIISCPPVTVPADWRVIDALTLINEHHISSVAVVDSENGRLVGNLSVADMKYLFSSSVFGKLGRSCMEFITEVYRQKDVESRHKSQAVVFAASENDTLLRCVSRLVKLRSHRLWVVSSIFQPLGMVSMTDILRLVTPHIKLHNLIDAPQA